MEEILIEVENEFVGCGAWRIGESGLVPTAGARVTRKKDFGET